MCGGKGKEKVIEAKAVGNTWEDRTMVWAVRDGGTISRRREKIKSESGLRGRGQRTNRAAVVGVSSFSGGEKEV